MLEQDQQGRALFMLYTWKLVTTLGWTPSCFLQWVAFVQWGLWHLTLFSEWSFKMLTSLLCLSGSCERAAHCTEAKQCGGGKEQELMAIRSLCTPVCLFWSHNLGHSVEQLLLLWAHKPQKRTSSVCNTPRISFRVPQAPFTHFSGWSVTFSPSLCLNSKGKHFTSVKFIDNKNILKQLLRTLFSIFYTSCWTTLWSNLNSI